MCYKNENGLAFLNLKLDDNFTSRLSLRIVDLASLNDDRKLPVRSQHVVVEVLGKGDVAGHVVLDLEHGRNGIPFK